jgi:hypothetical protein
VPGVERQDQDAPALDVLVTGPGRIAGPLGKGAQCGGQVEHGRRPVAQKLNVVAPSPIHSQSCTLPPSVAFDTRLAASSCLALKQTGHTSS